MGAAHFLSERPPGTVVPGIWVSTGRTLKDMSYFRLGINSKSRYPTAMILARKNAHVVTIPPKR